jgi:hypothetical protein
MTAPRPWDRYVFNVLPLPHTVLLTVLLTITLRIALSFHFHYGARPILTLCVVSSLLASISDTLAQTVETIRLRGKMAAKLRDLVPVNTMAHPTMEIELDEKGSSPHLGGSSPRWEASASEFGFGRGGDRAIDFDFPRMIRFMGYGFFFAPIAVTSLFLVCSLSSLFRSLLPTRRYHCTFQLPVFYLTLLFSLRGTGLVTNYSIHGSDF